MKYSYIFIMTLFLLSSFGYAALPITIDYPANDTYGSTIWFNISLSESGSWCGYSLDTAANISLTSASASSFRSVMPEFDAHVDNDQPTTNFGSSELATIKNQSGDEVRIYYSIDLDDISSIGSISDMELQIYSVDLTWPDTTVLVHYINNTDAADFNEGAITWNNQPCGTSHEVTGVNCSTAINWTDITLNASWFIFNVTEAARWSLINNPDRIVSFVLRTNITTNLNPGIRTTEYTVDTSLRPLLNITFTNTTAWSESNTSMAAGSHSIIFSCNASDDGELNTTSPRLFTIDLTAPVSTINQPENDTDYDGVFNVTFGETVSWSAYSLNGAANVSIGSVLSYQTILTSGFNQGSNYITVYANDSAGNMASSTRYWTTAPNTTYTYGALISSLGFAPVSLEAQYTAATGQSATNPAYNISPTTYPNSNLEIWIDANTTANATLTVSNTSSYVNSLNLSTVHQVLNWTVPTWTNVSMWIWLSLNHPNLSALDATPVIYFNYTA